MGRGVGQHVLEQAGIGHDGRARDAGHADAEQHEDLRAGEQRQVGADEDRALDLAHEDGGGGGEGWRAAQAHGLLEQEAEAVGDPLEDLPVPEQGRQGADHQDHRQHPEAEQIGDPGRAGGVGLGPAGQIAEHELGARLGRGGKAVDAASQSLQRLLGYGHAEQHQHQARLDEQGAGGQQPGEPPAVLGHGPADGQGEDEPGQALGVVQVEHQAPDRTGWSYSRSRRRRRMLGIFDQGGTPKQATPFAGAIGQPHLHSIKAEP